LRSQPTNPLPVEFDQFEADLINDHVTLSWSTHIEKNNDYFTIERSKNAEEFLSIGSIRGNGTSHVLHRYNFTDNEPLEGRSYYRLKQTDYDGKSAYHPEVKVITYIIAHPLLEVYPNPVDGETMKVQIKGLLQPSDIPIEIFNLQGSKVLEIVVPSNEWGQIEKEIDIKSLLPSGFYIVKAGKTLQLTRKVIVH
jgi:hypothetical protein